MMNNNADDIPQSERRRVMENDRKVREGSTYFQQAQASALDEMGGRFAKVQPTSVTGSAPGAWPKMPEGNPWATNPYPPEPLIDGRGEGSVLGYAIDRGSGDY
jgi:hypothetical protein